VEARGHQLIDHRQDATPTTRPDTCPTKLPAINNPTPSWSQRRATETACVDFAVGGTTSYC